MFDNLDQVLGDVVERSGEDAQALVGVLGVGGKEGRGTRAAKAEVAAGSEVVDLEGGDVDAGAWGGPGGVDIVDVASGAATGVAVAGVPI